MMTYKNIIKREIDNSYVIQKNGYSCHVPNQGEWEAEWAQINQYTIAHPEEVTIEAIPPTPTLTELKALKKIEIAGARYKAERAGMMFNGHPIATDDVGQNKITGAVLSAMEDVVYTIEEWLCADGTFISLSNADILDLGRALRDHVQDKFKINKELFEAVEAAQTSADLDAIEWSDEG